MSEFGLTRQYAYASSRGFAFELGYRRQWFRLVLLDAITSDPQDDAGETIRGAHIALTKLFNVVLDGHRSFPTRIDVERVDNCRFLTGSMRNAIGDWCGSSEHTRVRERSCADAARKTKQPDEVLPALYTEHLNAALDWLIETPFWLPDELWRVAVECVLRDLDEPLVETYFRVGGNLASVRFVFQSDSANRKGRLLESARSLMCALLDLWGQPAEAAKADEHDTDKHDDSLVATMKQIEDLTRRLGERESMPLFMERACVRSMRPYLIVHEQTGRMTFLKMDVNGLEPRHRKMLKQLCRDSDRPVTMDEIDKGGNRAEGSIQNIVSSIHGALSEALLGRADLQPPDRIFFEEWIERLGQKTRCDSSFGRIASSDIEFR